jgi:hypothetical protein
MYAVYLKRRALGVDVRIILKWALRWEYVDWIHVSHDGYGWYTSVSTVMKL